MHIAKGAASQRRAAVLRLAEDVQHPAQAIGRHRHMQRRAGVVHRHAALEAGSTVQRHRAQVAFVQVLVHLEQVGLMIEPGQQRLAQRRQALAGDLHHRPPHADDVADGGLGHDWASKPPGTTRRGSRGPQPAPDIAQRVGRHRKLLEAASISHFTARRAQMPAPTAITVPIIGRLHVPVLPHPCPECSE